MAMSEKDSAMTRTQTTQRDIPAPPAPPPSSYVARALGAVRSTLNELTILVAFILLCLYLALTTPSFMTGTNWLSILLETSLIAVVAIGETFVIVTGGIDLSVGSVVALTGIVAGMSLHSGMSIALSVVMGIAAGAGVGLFNGLSITFLNMNPFIVTLAGLAMARGLAFIVPNGNTIFGFDAGFDNIGGGNWGSIPIAAVISVAAFLVAYVILARTVFGSEVYAVGGNREAARLAGIPVRRTLIAVYTISGALAGLGGVILTGRLDAAQPIAATGLELNAIAAVVIGGASLFGGKGTMLGTLLGVLIIGVINNGLTLKNAQPFWVQFIQGAVIFAAVLIDSLNQKRRAAS